jgi:hypothetical protein
MARLGWFDRAPILGHPAIELFGIEANLFLATISVTLWLFAVGLVMIWTGVQQRGV